MGVPPNHPYLTGCSILNQLSGYPHVIMFLWKTYEIFRLVYKKKNIDYIATKCYKYHKPY